MLTKTRKWLVLIVVAVVALFLTACGTPEPEPVVPTAIEVVADVYVGQTGVLIGSEPMELSVITTPTNAIATVTWSSADTSIATVNAEGEVTGVKGGRVKITATSTEDTTVKDDIEILVYEHMENIRVLMAAMTYIKDAIPTYVDEDLTLPQYTNTLVTAEYYDQDGIKLVGGVYPYIYTQDTYDTVNVKLTYMSEILEFAITLTVVSDAEDNEFLAVEIAKEEISDFLADYVTNKVTADIELPATLSALLGVTPEEVDREVAITWTSTYAAVVTNAGLYIRPNDNTPFTFEVYYVCGGVSAVTRHPLVAVGYTQAEKIEYLEDNVLPTITELQGSNMGLPIRDAKFNTVITWTSSHPTVLSAAGKMDPYLEVETDVTLTAHIVYTSVVDPSYSFEQDVPIVITVKPAANDAQKIALDLSNKFSEAEFPHYFPWGLPGREGNTIPLPTTVGGDGEFKDIVITWTCAEEGLFDASWVLQKQYLRYHEVALTFSVTEGEATATGEVLINVGVAELPNTLYIGGRFANRSIATNPVQQFDELHTFSTDDPATGVPYEVDPMLRGHWTGFTFYKDVTDDNGVTWRYQYFANTPYTFYIEENVAGGVVVDEDGNMSLFDPAVTVKTANGVNIHANYQGMIIVNETSKAINIPIAFLNYKGSTITKDVNNTTITRQVSISIDGWRVGFVADADGVVTMGNGTVALETALTNAAEKDEEGNFTLPHYVTIPVGGFLWCPQTSQNKAVLGGVFSVVDNDLTVIEFAPKYGPMAPVE